jgi:anti-sigma factor RsiW
MTCRTIEELLPAYIENDLPAADRATVDRHLASCDACRRALAEFERLEISLVALGNTLPSWRAAAARFDERPRRARGHALARILLAPPAVAGIAMAAAGAALLSRGREITTALEPFGALVASRSSALGAAFARLVGALAGADLVLLSSIYALCALAAMLGSVRFALRWGNR